MCGICGVFYFDPNQLVDPHLIETMMDQIRHRGPDEGACKVDGSIGLGFRRLSIIDVGGSHQPMPNEDERVWIVFNGEIYNFQTLRANLIDRHSFRTAGDTETILHAYEDYGAQCVEHLRGMFAFAIWDSHAQQLALAVDRFGKKPMYYLLDDDKIIFASELKCILEHSHITRDLDMEALDEYLTNGYITAPRTIFKSIRKLLPGHTLTVERNGRVALRQYWHPHLHEQSDWDNRTADELAAELRTLLREAVRLRMISDVPLGAFLSGGVDSSVVVGLMSEVSDQPVRTFSIGFEEDAFDESFYAQEIAERFRTQHIREVVRPDVSAVLPKLIHQFDEPFADSSMIPTYYVSQVARQYVTVALSGDGGDEVFAGYHQYIYGGRHAALQAVVPPPLRAAAAGVGRYVPKLKPYLSVVDRSVAPYWGMRTDFFDAQARASLYTTSSAELLGSFAGEQVKSEALRRAQNLDWLGQLQYSDLTVYMPGDILVKVDRASMLASLEVRSPLLDHVVFEFMAHIPSRYKTNGIDTKILLKKAVSDLLPPEIGRRRKQGFAIPLAEWLAKPLQPLLRDALSEMAVRTRSLFEPAAVTRLIDEHTHGLADHKSRLWALLCFELWAREYLDRS
jgi:asparagine synthase (glutamine-hydrolysing)